VCAKETARESKRKRKTERFNLRSNIKAGKDILQKTITKASNYKVKNQMILTLESFSKVSNNLLLRPYTRFTFPSQNALAIFKQQKMLL